jgi:membrane protein
LAPNPEEKAEGRPDPLQRQQMVLAALRLRRDAGRAKREGGRWKGLLASAQYRLAQLNSWRLMRVFNLYGLRHGPLLAAGCAYNLFFSVAAMLLAGFSILGLVVSGNGELQLAIIRVVDQTTPGLINTTGVPGEGLVTPEQLFSQGAAFGVSLVISTAVLIWTSLGWIAGLRTGMRGIFDLPPLKSNIVLVKLKDLATLLILAVALIVTSALAVVANTALDLIVNWLQFDGGAAVPLTRIGGIVIMLLLDMAVAVILFRVASGIRMPRPIMLQCALIAGAGSTVLRYFSSVLLANVGNNPLLAPFAVVIGLFVWFYLLSQLYMVATAWGAIGKADAVARHALAGGRGNRSLRRRAWRLRRRRSGKGTRRNDGAAVV